MRIFFSILIVFLLQLNVFADVLPHTIYAVTQRTLSNTNLKPKQKIELHVIDVKEYSADIDVLGGNKIEVEIVDYVKPKRAKKDGYFKIKYKETDSILISGKMRVSTPRDIESIAKNAGVSVVGLILKVPGFSQIVAVSKGLINPNDNQSRLKSASENLYESTPLTYIEEGKDFYVEADGVVVLKLKIKEKN